MDQMSGALTTTPTDQTYNVQGATGQYSSYFTLYESNVVQDAYFANAQPIVNDQLLTSSAPLGDISADTVMVFLPGTTSIRVDQLKTSLSNDNVPSYGVIFQDPTGKQEPLDGTYVTNVPNNSPYVDFAAGTGNPRVTVGKLLSTLSALSSSGEGHNPIEVNDVGQPYSLLMTVKVVASRSVVVLTANQAI
jgi:hypothetical protein